MAEAARYYTWSTESLRYRSQSTGRYVSRAAVRASLDATLDVQMDRVRALSQGLVAGDVSLTDWRAQMSAALKTSHLEASAVAKGGWTQLTQSDYGWVGQRVRTQLGFLQDFHDDLAYERIPMDGTVASRAAMYVAAGRGTERSMEGRMASDRGEEMERNIGGDGDNSCDECIDCSEQGWVPIGTLPEVGERSCLANCHCWIDYRTGRPEEED